jgi:hypothetical protein
VNIITTHYITIKGYIKNGKLEVKWPDNAADGEVHIDIPVVLDGAALALEDLATMLAFEGKPLGEIEIGGWEDVETCP